MATVTKPIALDESFNTTEVTPRNIADVLAEGFSHITGRTASEVEYDNTDSGLTADNVQDALDEIAESVPTLPTTDIQTAVDEFETYNGGLLSSLKVALSPNQDLHGYDSPWVGGAGKNLLPNNITTETAYGVTYVTQEDGSIEGNGTSTGWANANLVNDLLLKAGTYILSGTTITGAYISVITLLGGEDYSITGPNSTRQITFETDTHVMVRISAKPATVLSNAKYYPMIRLATESDPTFAPYSNICPINGHTQVEVENHQKNLCDNSANIIGLWESDGIYHDNSNYRTSDLIEVSANTEYSVSLFDLSTNTRVNGLVVTEWDANSEIIRQVDGNTLTTTANTKYVRIRNYGANSALVKTSNYAYQLELGSTVTPYVPYNGYQVTVNLGGTYYSGTLDVVSGVFTVDGVYLKPSSVTNVYLESGSGLYYWVVAVNLGSINGANAISSHFKSENRLVGGNCYIAGSGAQLLVTPADQTLNTKALADAWMADNEPEFVYKLATPTPIQLSPTMVKALVGENHLSAPLEGQEITESKYHELFTWNEVEEIAQKIADSKIDNIYTSYNTTFSSAFTEARYVKKIYEAPALTALQIVLSGATSITFNHQLIFSDSQTCCELIQFGSGARIEITDVAISQGSVTFTFDSPLTKAIGFRCRITNDFVS